MSEIKQSLIENNFLMCRETALNIIEKSYKSEKEIRVKIQKTGGV
jgi:SOS response regulatory protein OraA/RecX